jgi:rubrerythrin
MGFDFNADEVLTMAMHIEGNGAKFYRKAAEHAAQPRVREKLLGLAAMEDEHEKRFAAMKNALTSKERAPLTFDPDDETPRFLEAMADGNVFDSRLDPSTLIKGREPPEEIFRIAIGLEKDSVVFYTGLKKAVPAQHGGVRIDEIIAEEMGHIADLSREIQALKK